MILYEQEDDSDEHCPDITITDALHH